LIASGDATASQAIGHFVWLAFEHEVMHLETYLYMLVQSSKATPPPGRTMADFERLGAEAERNVVPNEWFTVPASEVQLGLQDCQNDQGLTQYLSWDNEKPARYASVQAFEAQGRPISNGDYANYLREIRSTSIPASWVRDNATKVQSINGPHKYAHANGFVDNHDHHKRFCGSTLPSELSVRTVYGPIPLQYAFHWPLMASYDELAAYAKWAGGRIPTLEEARSLYFHVETSKSDSAEKVSSCLISAVNG
jgi:L-histidine Nalpha-methyltransferase / hercynylcysteine S-oxide synthase